MGWAVVGLAVVGYIKLIVFEKKESLSFYNNLRFAKPSMTINLTFGVTGAAVGFFVGLAGLWLGPGVASGFVGASVWGETDGV